MEPTLNNTGFNDRPEDSFSSGSSGSHFGPTTAALEMYQQLQDCAASFPRNVRCPQASMASLRPWTCDKDTSASHVCTEAFSITEKTRSSEEVLTAYVREVLRAQGMHWKDSDGGAGTENDAETLERIRHMTAEDVCVDLFLRPFRSEAADASPASASNQARHDGNHADDKDSAPAQRLPCIFVHMVVCFGLQRCFRTVRWREVRTADASVGPWCPSETQPPPVDAQVGAQDLSQQRSEESEHEDALVGDVFESLFSLLIHSA